MITIGDILRPALIDLDLKTSNQEEAVHHVASLLREDERVIDWTAFYEGLNAGGPCAADGETEICIPHTRTDRVSGMVMAVGRSDAGIFLPDAGVAIHFIFVIGVPNTLAADYLRIIGALTRIFRDPNTRDTLRRARTSDEFLTILRAAEVKL